MVDTNGVADSLRKVFMAGVGAMAAVGERGGQVVEELAERGESVVKQGRDLNRELVQKGAAAAGGIGEDVLRATLAALSPENRAKFVATAQHVADELDAADAACEAARAKPAGVTVPVQEGAVPEQPAESEGPTARDTPGTSA